MMFTMRPRWAALTAIALILSIPAFVPAQEADKAKDTETAKTDEEIKRILIQSSIRSYSGSCPCPYNTDRAGRRCGGRSAYSRPGGADPLCYPGDVSQGMVDRFREREKKKEKDG